MPETQGGEDDPIAILDLQRNSWLQPSIRVSSPGPRSAEFEKMNRTLDRRSPDTAARAPLTEGSWLGKAGDLARSSSKTYATFGAYPLRKEYQSSCVGNAVSLLGQDIRDVTSPVRWLCVHFFQHGIFPKGFSTIESPMCGHPCPRDSFASFRSLHPLFGSGAVVLVSNNALCPFQKEEQ